MDERLVTPRRSAQRGGVAAAAAIGVGVVTLAAIGWGDWFHAVVLGTFALLVVVGLALTVRAPLRPVLRVSPDGVEGAFGLIGWQDVTGVQVRRRFGLYPRGVVVRLDSKGSLLDPTREFAAGDVVETWRDRLVISTWSLDVSAEELARTIERYRASA